MCGRCFRVRRTHAAMKVNEARGESEHLGRSKCTIFLSNRDRNLDIGRYIIGILPWRSRSRARLDSVYFILKSCEERSERAALMLSPQPGEKGDKSGGVSYQYAYLTVFDCIKA